MDLTTVRERIQAHQYDTLAAMVDDLETMFSNAETYNEEGSQVYNDAEDLRRVTKAALRVCVACFASSIIYFYLIYTIFSI